MSHDWQLLLKSPPPNLTGWIRPCARLLVFDKTLAQPDFAVVNKLL